MIPAYCHRAEARTPHPVVLLVLVGALTGALPLLWVPASVVLGTMGVAASHVYTVAELRRQVLRTPQDWMGRTVQVQGRVVSYRARTDPFTWRTHVILIDAGVPTWGEGLPLVAGPVDPMLAVLRRTPLVGRLVPRPQPLHWDTLAIYRVQVHTRPGSSCTTCYEAVLLDAA